MFSIEAPNEKILLLTLFRSPSLPTSALQVQSLSIINMMPLED